LGEDIDVLYDFIHSGDTAMRARNNARIRDKEMKKGMDRESGDLNDFWSGRDYLNQMHPMKAALLMSHGFNDWNVMPEHSYRIYKKAEEMGIPSQLFYHQGGHGGPPPFSMMNRWFTRYLHGVENEVEQDAKVWIVRENDPQDQPTPYPAYPNPEASAVKLYLKGNAPAAGELNLMPVENQGTETLVDNYSFDGASLAQAELTKHRLLFVSPELKEDLHLSGVPEITIKLASNKPAANLSVWLVSLPWDPGKKAKITDNIITRGWADPQNHASLRKGKPLKPDKFYSMTFPLQPDDQIIPKGQKIGLMIFSSDKEFTVWPSPGTELTVDIEHTVLELPVVGGREALKQSFAKP
jgi:X-Pro dipeptidyl-peptidase